MVTTDEMHFWTLEMEFLVFLGSQNEMIYSKNGLLRVPRRAPKVQKLVSDAYPVNIGHFDHYVVIETKSGAAQDFQRG